MNTLRIALVLALVGGLAGCAKSPPVPVDRFYRLPEPPPLAVLPGADAWGKMVAVASLRSVGLHTERAVVFSEDAAAVMLERYHYHHWVDNPPRLLQDYLVARLRHALTNALVMGELEGRADTVVAGRVKRFEHHIDAKGSHGRALVMVELRVTRAGARKPVLIRDYEVSTAVSGAGMPATAQAFGEAVDAITAAFYKDATTALSAQ
ncbi:MAG: ABC-type uncharacterized transport system auxiliary subunit [Gammaproteobacteria bacterium]|jgi:ABC-type uncharacterized transport system auxiliary subunit